MLYRANLSGSYQAVPRLPGVLVLHKHKTQLVEKTEVEKTEVETELKKTEVEKYRGGDRGGEQEVQEGGRCKMEEGDSGLSSLQSPVLNIWAM